MNNIRCSDCGLVNWSSEESCKRCSAALISGRALQLTNEKSSGSPLKKLLLIIFVVAIVVIPFWVWQKRAARNREMAAAIRSSTLFAKPVTVEASSTGGFFDILNPEAIVLRGAGLLTIDNEPVSKPASAQPSLAEPNSVLIPMMRQTNQSRILNRPTLRLIPIDIAATRDWQTFEDREHHRSGWTVPVGTRELIELMSIEEAGTDTVQIQFTWKWKPNEVGRHFDINETVRQSDPHRRRKSNPRLSSEFPFKGTAELSRTGNGWEVKTIKWNLDMPERVY